MCEINLPGGLQIVIKPVRHKKYCILLYINNSDKIIVGNSELS